MNLQGLSAPYPSMVDSFLCLQRSIDSLAKAPFAHVAVMSGDPSSQELVLRCLGAGACECLVKPIRRHDLEGLWKHSWRRNASLPLRSLSGYWTTSSGPAPAVSISIADKLQVSVKGDENSSPRMPPVLHLPMGRGFKGGGSDGGSDTSSRDRQSAHPWNGSGDKGSGSTENTDSGEDEAPKPSTSLPAGQQGGPRGPVSVLPRGLQELAQLGNLREAEQRNHRGLKSHQQKAAAALRHSNSCSAFSAFASIDDANRTSSAAELQYQEAAHFQPPSFFSPPQQNPRLQIVPSLLISGWGGLPGGFGPGLGAPPLVHPAITSLYEQIMHNMVSAPGPLSGWLGKFCYPWINQGKA